MLPLMLPAADTEEGDDRRFDLGSFLLWLGALALVTVAMLTVRARLDKAHIALGYLLVVLGAGASTGRRIGVTLSVVAFLCFNYFFLPPYLTFAIAGRGAHWLSPIAIKIITRLMGLLLAAVAIQFIFNAIKGEGGLFLR